MRTVFLIVGAIAVCSCDARRDNGLAPERIGVEVVATFGDSLGDGMLSSYPWPSAPTERGLYLVADQGRPGPVPVFDSTGRFVQSIGGAGEGPDEFRNVEQVLVTNHDSIVVIDGSLLRASVFSPELEYVRSFPLPFMPSSVRELGQGRFLLVPGTQQPQQPFTLVDADGNRIPEFGTTFDSLVPYEPHLVAVSGSGGFWSTTMGSTLVLEEWDGAGQKVRAVRPVTPWATPYDERTSITPEVPPQWSIRGMWQDGSDRLIVLALVADPDWARGLGEPQPGEAGTLRYRVTAPDKVYDAVISVIDPATGKEVARRHLDAAYRMVVSPGLIGRVIEDDAGVMRVEVARVRIE